MHTHTNAPESANLSKDDLQIFEAARAAAASLAKTFELWITIARAVELARIKANRTGRRDAFQRIIEQQGLAGVLGSTWNAQKSTAHKLLKILENLSEVTAWQKTLTQHQRISWSAPTTIYKHCPVFAVDRPEREDAAALAKVDKIVARKSGIDWAPADEATMRQSLSEAHAANQKLKVEVAELRTRVGVMAMVDAATDPGPEEDAALQKEFEERFSDMPTGGYGLDPAVPYVKDWFESRIVAGRISPRTAQAVGSNLMFMAKAYWGRGGTQYARTKLSMEQQQAVVAERKRKAQERVKRFNAS